MLTISTLDKIDSCLRLHSVWLELGIGNVDGLLLFINGIKAVKLEAPTVLLAAGNL